MTISNRSSTVNSPLYIDVYCQPSADFNICGSPEDKQSVISNASCSAKDYLRSINLRTYKINTYLLQRLQKWCYNEVNRSQITKTTDASFQWCLLPATSTWPDCARAATLTQLRLPVPSDLILRPRGWPRKRSMESTHSKLTGMLQTSGNSSIKTTEKVGFEV